MPDSTFKYSFKSPARESIALTVYNTGYQKCESGYQWGPAVRDHFLIHYVDSGRGSYSVAGKTYPVGPGEMFLVQESEVVSYRADAADPWEYYWVGFNGTDAKRLLNMTPFSQETRVIHCGEMPDLKLLLVEIYRSNGTSSVAEAAMLGHLYLFLAELIRLGEPAVVGESGNRRYVRVALQYIQYNYSRKIDVEDIARAVGVSRSHLYRFFMKHLSISPSDYLAKYRINEACTLLRNSNLTVAEVASSVGFDDPLYFSRVFKKLKGVPPSRFQ